MAVEIKELVIRAVVDYGSAAETRENTRGEEMPGQVDQKLIQACVKQVLKILKQQQKR